MSTDKEEGEDVVRDKPPPKAFGLWKPDGQEFELEVDHKAIASKLGLEVDQVEFRVEPELREGVMGKTLIGEKA